MTLNSSENPPSTYPSTLFETDFGKDDSACWHVARTKSRQEKALARDLMARKIEYFLPLIHSPQKSRKRIRMSVLPLFSGYLFFRSAMEHTTEVLRTRRVAQILNVADQETLVAELKNLHILLKRDKRVELSDFYQKGQMVEVTHGPLEGLTGRISRIRNRTYLTLFVNCIGQGAKVEIAMDQVRPLGVRT